MSVLSQKLKALKLELKSWNKLVFGNIHLRVNNALAAVESIQHQIVLQVLRTAFLSRKQWQRLNFSKL